MRLRGIVASPPPCLGHATSAGAPTDSLVAEWPPPVGAVCLAEKSDLSMCVTCSASACSLCCGGLQCASCLRGPELAYATHAAAADVAADAAPQRPERRAVR